MRHPEERRRLQALREYGVLDAPDAPRLEALVALAAKLCETGVAFVNVIDEDRQHYLAEVGMGKSEAPRDPGVCNYAMLQNGIFEVPDAALDPRFADEPSLTGENGLRFYAGAPLRTPEGLPLGTLCVMDHNPRRLKGMQRDALQGLADAIMALLDLFLEVRRLERGRAIERTIEPAVQAEAEFLRTITDRLPVRVGYLDRTYRYVFLNGAYERMFGFAPREAWGRHVEEIVGPAAWASARPHVERAMAGESNVQELTVAYPFGDLRVEAGFTSDFGPDGAVRGVVVYGSDVTARYEAQQALEGERAELDRTLDTAEVATWRWEIATDKTYASPRLQFFFGLSDENANGGPVATYLAAMHEDDRPHVAAALGASRETGARYEVEYRVRGADGRERWVIARGSADLGPDGTAHTLSGVLVDITDRKRDEEELRKRNERVRLLAEGSADMLARQDPAEMVKALYARIKDALGLDAFFHFMESAGGEGLCLEAYEGVAPETAWEVENSEAGRSLRDVVVATREPMILEHLPSSDAPFAELVRPLGFGVYAVFPLLSGGRLLGTLSFLSRDCEEFDASDVDFLGAVARYVATARERLRTEVERERLTAELVESEARFRAAQEESPDGFMAFNSLRDETGRIVDFVWTHANEASARIVERPREAFKGRRLLDVLPGNRDEGLFDAYVRVTETGEPFTHETTYKHDGLDVYLRITAVKVDDGFAVTFADLSERRRAEEALRRSEERFRALSEALETRVAERTVELQEAVRESEGFNYSIAHDLRAPLRAIVSTASILREDLGEELGETYREMLDRQAYNASRLGRLIDELLRLSRLARVAVNREPLDMTEKARSVADELDPSRRIEVQEGMTAEGDPGLVRTVLQNLVGNAFKFSPPESTVRVGFADGAFWVRDEGVGFDMQYASKLFLPFERLVRDEEFEGTGIGLANVERIVRRHGGRVWAESEPGKGAAFLFTLG